MPRKKARCEIALTSRIPSVHGFLTISFWCRMDQPVVQPEDLAFTMSWIRIDPGSWRKPDRSLLPVPLSVVLRRRSNLVQPTRAPGATKGATRGLAFVSSLGSLTKAKSGGADRDRTDDLKLAKLPLSQLSYGPKDDLISTRPASEVRKKVCDRTWFSQPARFARRAQGFVSSLRSLTKPKCGGPGTS